MSFPIGSLWLKESKDNTKYFSGVLKDLRGDIPVVIFKNGKKESEKQPDYLMYRSEPKEEKTNNVNIEDIKF